MNCSVLVTISSLLHTVIIANAISFYCFFIKPIHCLSAKNKDQMQITQVHSVLMCKYCMLSRATGVVPGADTYLPPHRRAPPLCHSPCLASALESVSWQYIPWAPSPAAASLRLGDHCVAEQPVEQRWWAEEQAAGPPWARRCWRPEEWVALGGPEVCQL